MANTSAGTERVVTYTISLTITRAVRLDDYDSTIEESAQWMASAKAKQELEREVLRALRVLDGDCDCEVMEAK